ncbi:MAG TPA: hypothetical protein VM509_03285 [Planctomycetota bacterium]|nr:hypothetical protein [Planctomycetota bacterium]
MSHTLRPIWIWSTGLFLSACAAPMQETATENRVPPVVREQEPAPDAKARLAESARTAFQQQDWSLAGREYEALVAQAPEVPLNWLRLGQCKHMLKDYAGAIAAYAHVESGPAASTARYNTACALALQGKREPALDELERAVAAGFNDAKTMAADSDLASVHGDPRFEAALAKVKSSAPVKFVPPAEARQFDFWVGDWDVLSVAGAKAGDSKIENILGGCAIQENWTSASGNSGKSFNVYDAKKREWRQHWIDDSGTETFYAGAFEDGCMDLVAESTGADGKPALHRMRFFDLGTEGVRQWGEVSTDGGSSWKTEFDLHYRRK